jgi:hypothetical protein
LCSRLAERTDDDQRRDDKTDTNAHDKTPRRSPKSNTILCKEDWAATRQQSEQSPAIGEREPVTAAL